MTPPQILPARTCTCGHPESAHNFSHACSECGQDVVGDDRCTTVGCRCEGCVAACQNCGEEMEFSAEGYCVCSRRCLFQIQYALQLGAAA